MPGKLILNKLKKILLHARSAEKIGNKKEAKAYYKQFKTMSQRHNVSLKAVEDFITEHQPVGKELVSPIARRHEDWEIALFSHVTSSRKCYGLVLDAGLLAVVGTPSQRTDAIAVHKKLARICEHLASGYVVSLQSVATQIQFNGMNAFTAVGLDAALDADFFRTSFLHGLVDGITPRLYPPEPEWPDEITEGAMVVYDRTREKLDNYMRNNPCSPPPAPQGSEPGESVEPEQPQSAPLQPPPQEGPININEVDFLRGKHVGKTLKLDELR